MTGCAQLPGRTLTESAAQKTASERRRRRCLVAVIMAENAVHPRRTAGDGLSCGASARIFHAIFCHREPDERERGDPAGRRPATDSAPTPPSGRSRFTASLSAAPDPFSAGACRTSSPGSLQIASAIGGRRTIFLPVQRRSFEPWRAPVEPSLPFPSPQTPKPDPVRLLKSGKKIQRKNVRRPHRNYCSAFISPLTQSSFHPIVCICNVLHYALSPPIARHPPWRASVKSHCSREIGVSKIL